MKALVAAVVGGIGSVPGAFLGGVCVALIEAGWSAYFDITARDIVVFSLLIVVFVLRPGGLLGFAGPQSRAMFEGRRVTVTLADIEAARRTIGTQVLRTPMLPAPKLSELTGAQVWVKYENLQVTNSFKERGALNKLAALSAAERKRGVIAMSAGNHAQAVAYHARRLGIPATIVMPVTTPFVKVAATEAYGATVVLDGEAVSDAQARAEAIAQERSLSGCTLMTIRM